MSDDKNPSTLMCALVGIGGAAAVVGVMSLIAGKPKAFMAARAGHAGSALGLGTSQERDFRISDLRRLIDKAERQGKEVNETSYSELAKLENEVAREKEQSEAERPQRLAAMEQRFAELRKAGNALPDPTGRNRAVMGHRDYAYEEYKKWKAVGSASTAEMYLKDALRNAMLVE
jgi:superfamily II DNA/RNA helicase